MKIPDKYRKNSVSQQEINPDYIDYVESLNNALLTANGMLDNIIKNKAFTIEFYNKDNGVVINSSDHRYFVMNDVVYCDNDFSTESQEASVFFDDFIKECPAIGWRIIS